MRRIARILPILLAAGCVTGPEMPRSAGPYGLLDTPVGPLLGRLWEAHGGLESWRRYGRATVVVKATGSPELAAPPARLSFALGGWSDPEVELERAGNLLDLRTGGVPLGDARSHDYQVRTARVFFQLPFFLAVAGWELRRDVVAEPELEGPANAFWAIPATLPSPHLGYYIVTDPETGLLRTVYYQVRHPYLHGLLFAAEFRRYRWVDGVRFATEIKHRLIADLNARREVVARAVDPFDPLQSSLPAAPLEGEATTFHPFRHGFDWTLHLEDITLEESEPEPARQAAEASVEQRAAAPEKEAGESAEGGPEESPESATEPARPSDSGRLPWPPTFP